MSEATLSEEDLQFPPDDIGGSSASANRAGAPVADMDAFRRARAPRGLPGWMDAVIPALFGFIDLQADWDTYGGRPLRRETGMFALQVLHQAMTASDPPPLAVPTSAGGVQFEWYQPGLELEFLVNAPYDCELWYRRPDTGEEDAISLTTDFSPLRRWISELTQRGQVAA